MISQRAKRNSTSHKAIICRKCFKREEQVVKAQVEEVEGCDSQVMGYLSLWLGCCTQSCSLTLLLLKDDGSEEVSAAVHLKKRFHFFVMLLKGKTLSKW